VHDCPGRGDPDLLAVDLGVAVDDEAHVAASRAGEEERHVRPRCGVGGGSRADVGDQGAVDVLRPDGEALGAPIVPDGDQVAPREVGEAGLKLVQRHGDAHAGKRRPT